MAKNPHNEQGLLLAMSSGNIAAFEAILSQYEKPIWNHLRRITGSTDDAADLTQETFVKLWLKRDLVDSSNNFKNYLYRIATNTAYDLFRARGRMPEVHIADNETTGETIPQELTYSIKEQEILSHDTETALSHIAPHYRTILLLYYREGFSYDELAEMLEIPLNTVKTHMRRAKQALREHLQNYE